MTSSGRKRENVSLRLPDGQPIISKTDLSFKPHEPVLVTGPSGSGKSTLFRAISGIWPFMDGVIDLPKDARLMLLPQKPYIPNDTLRAAVTYPSAVGTFEDKAIIEAFAGAGLSGLSDKLDVQDNWSLRLSGGEQQRLAIARALLVKPDWLFLDEATAAMDEAMEAKIYRLLADHLPATTIVSIGHRSTLAQFHKRRVEMLADNNGTFTPADMAKEAAE